MSEIALAAAKEHCAVPASFDGHDAMIQGYIDAAEAHVASHIRRDMAADYPNGWPSDIKQAVLFLVGHYYANREAVSVGTIATTMPLGPAMLLAPYRDFAA